LRTSNPCRGLAALAGVGPARGDQDEGPDEGQADHPAQYERRPVGARARRAEHEHDGDDRDRTERDPDSQWEDLSDGLGHGTET